MSKKITIILILIIFTVGIGSGLYYINTVFIPKYVKEKITTGLKSLTQGNVTIENIHFDLFRGIVISGLLLSEKDNPKITLCSIKEASISFLIWPFFSEKKIILPSIELKSAVFNIIRHKDNSLNVTYLFDKLKTKGQGASIPILLVQTIVVRDSSVSFKDETFETAIPTQLKNINMTVRWAWNKIILDGTCELMRQKQKTDVHLRASYDLKKQRTNIDLLTNNLDLKLYSEYLTPLPVTFETGQLTELKLICAFDTRNIEAKIDLSSKPIGIIKDKNFSIKDCKLSGHAFLHSPIADFARMVYEGKLVVESGSFSSKEPVKSEGKIEKSTIDFSGDTKSVRSTSSLNFSDAKIEKDALKSDHINAEAKVLSSLAFNPEENFKPSFEGEVKIKNAEVSGVPKIGSITEITSTLKFKDSEITIEDLLAKLLDTHVKAKGTLKQNVLDLDLSGDFDLKQIAPLVSGELKLPPYEVDGTTTLDLHVTSNLSQGSIPFISGEAALKNVQLRFTENNFRISTDQGSVKFDTKNESLRWHLPILRYLTQEYSFDGNLKNFKKPAISGMITGKDLKLHADLTKDGEIITFSALKGQFKKSEVNLEGICDFKKNLKLTGTILLDFADLKDLALQWQEKIGKMGLSGECFVKTEISGPSNDYSLWNIKANGSSKMIKLYGLRFQNVRLDYSQTQRKGFINGLSFSAYKGQGFIRGHFDFSKKNIPYWLRVVLENVDLELLKLDTPMKDKAYSGILAMNVSLTGEGEDLDSIKGDGSFTIKNGNVCEFNPLKGLGNFLFIPRFNCLLFTQAQGDFSIHNSQVWTDNLELLGPDIGLMAEGKITFGGDLDFIVNTQINQPQIKGQENQPTTSKGSLTAIKLTGTVDKPKYKLEPIGENIMKKLGEIFSNIVP